MTSDGSGPTPRSTASTQAGSAPRRAPRPRHALDLRADAWRPTLAFLEAHPTAQDEGKTSSSATPAVVAIAVVAALALAGALVLGRRRQSAS